MVGSAAVIMAMNNSREGEDGEAVQSLVRRRCLMVLGMARWGQLAKFFTRKLSYVCKRATNAGNNYIANL